MVITIKTNRFIFKFWLPLSILKFKWIREAIKIDFDPRLLKVIKSYVKKNGHFNLLELTTEDGYKIKLKI